MKLSVLNNFYLNYLDRDKIRHSANLYWSHQKRQNTFALYTFEFFFPSAAWRTSIHFCKFTSQPCGHSSDKASIGCFCLSNEHHLNQMKNLYNEDTVYYTLRFCLWNDVGLLHNSSIWPQYTPNTKNDCSQYSLTGGGVRRYHKIYSRIAVKMRDHTSTPFTLLWNWIIFDTA